MLVYKCKLYFKNLYFNQKCYFSFFEHNTRWKNKTTLNSFYQQKAAQGIRTMLFSWCTCTAVCRPQVDTSACRQPTWWIPTSCQKILQIYKLSFGAGESLKWTKMTPETLLPWVLLCISRILLFETYACQL